MCLWYQKIIIIVSLKIRDRNSGLKSRWSRTNPNADTWNWDRDSNFRFRDAESGFGIKIQDFGIVIRDLTLEFRDLVEWEQILSGLGWDLESRKISLNFSFDFMKFKKIYDFFRKRERQWVKLCVVVEDKEKNLACFENRSKWPFVLRVVNYLSPESSLFYQEKIVLRLK